jgi:hypothetical protein
MSDALDWFLIGCAAGAVLMAFLAGVVMQAGGSSRPAGPGAPPDDDDGPDAD